MIRQEEAPRAGGPLEVASRLGPVHFTMSPSRCTAGGAYMPSTTYRVTPPELAGAISGHATKGVLIFRELI